MMWVVMTSSAKMPSSCKGHYRRVAIVQLTAWYTARNLRPAMISERAKGVLRVRDLGKHNVGKTERCAYAKAVARAEQLALELNSAPTVEAGDEILMTWGGSA